MADSFDDWYVHTVTVETVGPPDEWGQQTTSNHTVNCWIDDIVQLVRDRDGQEVVSTATVWVALADAVHFEPGSPVTVSGRQSRVISVRTGDSTTGDELDGAAVIVA